MSTPWDAAKGGLVAGAVFASLEASLALYMPIALDPSPTPLVFAASIAGTAVLIALLAWLASAINARSAVGIALALCIIERICRVHIEIGKLHTKIYNTR